MPKSDTKTGIKVKANIKTGPASPAQKASWRKFWQKLIAEVKAEEKESPPGQAPAKDALTGGDEEGTSHDSE